VAELARDAGDLVAAAAVLIGLLVLAVTRSVRTALPVLLDLLLAAGLLRLSADLGWGAIAGAAAIVLIRKLVSFGLSEHSHLPRRSRLSG